MKKLTPRGATEAYSYDTPPSAEGLPRENAYSTQWATTSALEESRRAVEHGKVQSQSRIELLSLSQKAQAEASIQQEQSHADFIVAL